MTARQSAAMDRAVARVLTGETARAAAGAEGLSAAAVYAALRRNQAMRCPGCGRLMRKPPGPL